MSILGLKKEIRQTMDRNITAGKYFIIVLLKIILFIYLVHKRVCGHISYVPISRTFLYLCWPFDTADIGLMILSNSCMSAAVPIPSSTKRGQGGKIESTG